MARRCKRTRCRWWSCVGGEGLGAGGTRFGPSRPITGALVFTMGPHQAEAQAARTVPFNVLTDHEVAEFAGALSFSASAFDVA